MFILCAEVLALLVKNNKNIKGINFGVLEQKITQYADDTTFILDGSKQSLSQLIDTLEHFTELSGLKINNEKTKTIWIGSKKFSKDVYHHRWKLTWGDTNFSLLGIDFSVNLNDMVYMNYKKQLEKIDKLISQWSRRILTPIGRITIIKTLIISKLNHLFLSLPNPSEETLNILNTKLFRFIWQNTVDKVKRETLASEYDKGVLK